MNEPIVMTINAHGKKLTIETPWDTDINEMMDMFHAIAVFATFMDNTWKNAIIELAQEYGTSIFDEVSKDWGDNDIGGSM